MDTNLEPPLKKIKTTIQIQDADLLYDLGKTYMNHKVYKKALEYLTLAADLGHVCAINTIGYLYYTDNFGAVDYEKAIYWYNKTAKFGNSDGQCMLAFMYLHGHGVKKDYNKSLYWFKQSAWRGNKGAQLNLYYIYENGLCGQYKDQQRSEAWYRIYSDSNSNKLKILYEQGKITLPTYDTLSRKYYPPQFKKEVLTWYLVAKRLGIISKDMREYVVEHLARLWQ